MREEAKPGLRADTRGAVYVEFLIAFMPVFVFFLCLLQLALLYTTQVWVEHAATTGSRAAAVVFADEPNPYKEQAPKPNTMSKERRDTVRGAVLIGLAPLILDESITAVTVTYPDGPSGSDQPVDTAIPVFQQGGMVRVKVQAIAVCKIAIANAIACVRLGNGTLLVRTITTESMYPYQGANYAYE